ncbi:MAG: ATP-binding protein [Hadesarchaea archaeon]|nr:ATP-binding protein [Hadesarchaea archaeon]
MDSYKSDSGDIRVADITIAQLSRGLYRSTATVFKELVSNAHDADATIVRIDTNYPEFDFISCVDDGTGMPLAGFKRFFSDVGIGSCIKRKHGKDVTDIYKRPIIGRLGIGILAVGQLCHSFEIESHYKDKDGKGRAFKANIILSDVTIPDKEKVLRDDDTKKKEIEVGKWEYEEIPYDKTKKGFRIYSSDVRSTFRNEMKSSIGEKERERLSFSLSDLHSEFYDKSKKSIRDCKPYLESIWELATLIPVPYYGKKEESPISLASFTSKEKRSDEFKKTIKFMRDRQQQLLNENFRVIFDGIELRRHIQLPTEEDTISKLYFVEFNNTVLDSRLKFSGYLFAQVPRAIIPLELNGVQIRLRGVGVGGYDHTFLKYYEEIETVRSKWVSGEIFVDKGLEEALNIDRDSFNEHDEHFKKLQSVLHEKLNPVFDEINGIARECSEEKRDERDNELRENLRKIVAEKSNKKFKLLQRDLGEAAPIVTVDKGRGVIILNKSARPLKRKKPDMIIRAVMLAYHIAKHTTKNEVEREVKFRQLVGAILGELA